MKYLKTIISGLFVFGVAGCNMEIYPQPYRSPVVLSTQVSPHVYLVTPLSGLSYSVQYFPGAISERAIVNSFAPHCTTLGRRAVRGLGPTRRQFVRRNRWQRGQTVNMFTVICR